jgi:YVTN family beta-propeller protein
VATTPTGESLDSTGVPPSDSDVRTFLIADVRGYTRFTQEHGDEEAGSLAAAFAELARDVVASHSGHVLELRGDEALCVFASARRALRAAVELQTRFRTADEDGFAFPLGVGIGLDAGEAVPIEGGYRGASLNLAARLCSLAKPGEILASETVVGLAGRLEGVLFAPRRAVRLKGIDRPVRVIEIVSETPLPPLPETSRKQRLQARWIVTASVAAVALLGALVALGITRATTHRGLATLAPNSVGILDGGSGKISSDVHVGGTPSALATGPGDFWVANAVDGTVSRVDAATKNIHTIPVGASPTAIAYGAGAAWVANNEDRTVSRIAPASNKVVQVIPVGNGPRALAVGSGAVWVANGVDGTVSRIDPRAGKVVRTIAVGANPSGLAVAAGALWVASQATGSVSEVDPSSGAILATTSVGHGPTAITSDGRSLWVANGQDGTVSRIDPATGAVGEVVPVGRNPSALAAGLGSVWVANADDGTVTQIDAATRKPERTISVGTSPTALAVGAGGVWTATVAAPASHKGGTLRVEDGEGVWGCGCFDPQVAWNGDAWQLMANVYDGLVGYRRVGGAQGGSLVPDLATAIPTPTDGGRTYTFQLRPRLRFSDGRPVTPTDVRASFERIFKAGYPFNQNPMYTGIVGGDECAVHPARCDLSRGIETNDAARTVVIHLVRPDADFLFKLALPFASVVPADSAPEQDETTGPLGTGPYAVAEFDKNRLRLVRNLRFAVWSRDAQPSGYPDEIAADFGGEPDAQIQAVVRGDADYLGSIPAERIGELSARFSGQLHSDPLPATTYAFLRTSFRPFDDVRVRRALNYAVDRRKVVELAGGPLATQATCQFLPPNIPGYIPNCPYTLDPNPAGTWTAPDVSRANKLIEASGTRGMRVTLYANTSRTAVARYLVGLLDELGYRASLRIISDDGKYWSTVYGHERPVQIALSGWVADYIAPSNFLATNFQCPSRNSAGGNDSEFCDPKVDRMMARAAEQQFAEPAQSLALWAKVDRAVTDEAPVVFLENPRVATLVSQRVGNFQAHPEYGPLLDQLWVR